MKFRYCTDRKGYAMLQVWGRRPRYVLADNDGEGDLKRLGKKGAHASTGAWINGPLPKWATQFTGLAEEKT